MKVTNPYEFIGFGAMEVTKPYEFIGFGAWEGPRSLRPFFEMFSANVELGTVANGSGSTHTHYEAVS